MMRGQDRATTDKVRNIRHTTLEALIELVRLARRPFCRSSKSFVSGKAKLQREARREANAKLVAQILAEQQYRAAVADMAEVLRGANVEAARAALRSLIGIVPIFEDSGQLYGRVGINPLPLFQSRNPQNFGGVVAGDRFEETCIPAQLLCRTGLQYPRGAALDRRSRSDLNST
jgi:hypothetical protein